MRDVFESEGVGATDECFFDGHAVLWIKSGESSSGTNPSFGTARAFPAMASVPFVSTRIVASSSLRASSLNRRQETFPCRTSARSHNRGLPRLRATDAETTGDGDGEASCDRPATARGKCDAHGGGRARKICVEQGCETRVVSGEKCTAHGGGGGCGTEVRVFRLSQIPQLVTAPGRRPLVNQRKCTAHSTSALLPAFYGVQVESHTTTELPNP